MFYVISPAVQDSIVVASFQNTKQTESPESVNLIPSTINIDD